MGRDAKGAAEDRKGADTASNGGVLTFKSVCKKESSNEDLLLIPFKDIVLQVAVVNLDRNNQLLQNKKKTRCILHSPPCPHQDCVRQSFFTPDFSVPKAYVKEDGAGDAAVYDENVDRAVYAAGSEDDGVFVKRALQNQVCETASTVHVAC